ncbi:uncharacterized protein LOC143259586 isoform X4 [Megalopta genalis]|uniref:uncharacterized protein LOC143259586 isoform X4 n=1 Tax=Megalopta genalis TaxID=115081 RepID=UPI003FD2F0D1
MDVFRKNYSTYYSILSLAGLWPYDESLIGKLQRVVLSLLTLLCIVIQISTLKLVELSLSNIITLLSYTFPLLLYFLRYVGFVVNFPVIRSVFENVERDCKTLENSVEVDMLLKHMAEARRIIQAYVVMSCLVAAYVTVSILLPTLLRSKLQLHYLHMFGFFYTEGGQQIDRVCVHLVLVSVMGQITLAGTESSLAVFSAYFCGLFDIASYRIRGAVNKMVNSVTLELIDIQSAIEVHQRALELAAILTKNMMLSYLVAIVTVVVSFAVNLYRFLLATKQLDDVENLAFSWNLVASHIIIMFLNNYSGQKLITTSIDFFNQTSVSRRPPN